MVDEYRAWCLIKLTKTLKNRHATFKPKYVITEEIHIPQLSIWTDKCHLEIS